MMKMDAHIHSDFSDGENSIREITCRAVSIEMDALAIVDHVRSDSTWLLEYRSEIEKARRLHGNSVKILSGLEAKCLDLRGNMDVPAGVEHCVDFIAGAIHRLPTDRGLTRVSEIQNDKAEILRFWSESVLAMLRNPVVTLWCHPGRILKTLGIDPPPEICEVIASEAAENRKFVERNVKYGLPEAPLLRALELRDVDIIPGSDSHSIEEMIQYSEDCTCGEPNGRSFIERVRGR